MNPRQPLAEQLHVESAERPAASQLQAQSHLGGDPYFDASETWPTNPDY